MKVNKLSFGIVFVLMLISSLQAREQITDQFNTALIMRPGMNVQQFDSLDILTVDSIELNHIKDLRTVFENQNKTYSTPKAPGENLLRFLKKDELEISNEAMYWAEMVRDASYYFDDYVTFRDTVIVDPIFLPIIFRGDKFTDEELTFYSMDFLKPKFKKEKLYKPVISFEDFMRRKESGKMAIRYIEQKHPSYIRYTEKSMPTELLKTTAIKKQTYDDIVLKVESDADFSDVTPVKFIPERQYWISGFESAVQFSQNYVSENWHKGGSSNLNLFTKNVLSYNYVKDKVQIINELEYRATIYTASKDTENRYKIGDDVLRLHNNIGYKAFNKWSYTFDTELKTQLFKNFKENSKQKQAAFIAPFTATFGVGMKYDLKKQFLSSKHKNVSLAVNLAPLSLKYMYSNIKDPEEIDLGRHGFKIDETTNMYENSFAEFGSNIDAQLVFNFSRNITWQSRLNYFTSYDNVKAEFENTLILGISRFFTTRINLHLRFDDTTENSDPDLNYWQVNELLSFGFNYRW